MKIVIQRVSRAKVEVNKKTVGEIAHGLLLLVCFEKGDSEETALKWAKRIPDLRVFADGEGKMNLSLIDVKGSLLVVSQFTLSANLHDKGRRPSFHNSEHPTRATELLAKFIEEARKIVSNVQQGEFGAHMEVELLNDGPVTFIVED